MASTAIYTLSDEEHMHTKSKGPNLCTSFPITFQTNVCYAIFLTALHIKIAL